MKLIVSAIALAFATLSAPVFAAAHAASAPMADKKPTAQQSKMTTCNKDAGDKKLEGDARKSYMKDCLSAKPVAAKPIKPRPRAANASPAIRPPPTSDVELISLGSAALSLAFPVRLVIVSTALATTPPAANHADVGRLTKPPNEDA